LLEQLPPGTRRSPPPGDCVFGCAPASASRPYDAGIRRGQGWDSRSGSISFDEFFNIQLLGPALDSCRHPRVHDNLIWPGTCMAVFRTLPRGIQDGARSRRVRSRSGSTLLNTFHSVRDGSPRSTDSSKRMIRLKPPSAGFLKMVSATVFRRFSRLSARPTGAEGSERAAPGRGRKPGWGIFPPGPSDAGGTRGSDGLERAPSFAFPRQASCGVDPELSAVEGLRGAVVQNIENTFGHIEVRSEVHRVEDPFQNPARVSQIQVRIHQDQHLAEAQLPLTPNRIHDLPGMSGVLLSTLSTVIL